MYTHTHIWPHSAYLKCTFRYVLGTYLPSYLCLCWYIAAQTPT